MKRFTLFIVPLYLFSFFSCTDKAVDYTPEIDFQTNKKASALIEADNAFSLDLFREVYTNTDEENFMISPVSVAIALGMTYNGADGETKSSFEETLRLNGMSRHDINYIHGALIKHLLKADPKVTMEIANSIWMNKYYTLLQEFADTNVYYYDAAINNLNFSDPGAVDIINNWISDKTHDKINNVLDFIPAEAVMYLINALYFNGTWKYEFEEQNVPMDFHFSDGSSSELQVMEMESDLNVYSDEKFTMFDLPYGDDKYTMTVLLPGEEFTTDDLSDELTLENWNEWLNGMQKKGVHLKMPKFKYDYKVLLNDALINMGLEIAFTDNAEFPLMVEETNNLAISRVIHQTFVDVNEKGTEAAAVTVVEVSLTSTGPGGGGPLQIRVDKPFIYVIREKQSNALVFMGRVGDPVYQE